jgi:UPF0716 protein FxsA
MLLFIVVPIVELTLLIKVGSFIGVLPTIAIVFTTAVVGASLLRREGFSTLAKAQQRLQSGQMPATELVEGALLVVGGAFLLTPGFVTDAFGFACLLPPVRRRMATFLLKRMTLNVKTSSVFDATQQPFGPEIPDRERPDPTVIEGEFQRKD